MAEQADKLKRTVSFPLLTLYGLGTILGAGIYVVIGKIIGEAGYWAALAFLLAATAAAFTALTYAELSSRIPESGGPVAYTMEAFSKRWLSVVIGWMIVATGVVSAATIVTGFVGYLEVFFEGLPSWAVVAGLVVALTGVALLGMKESAWFMGVTTAAGIAGLLLVLWETRGNFADLPRRFSESAEPLSAAGTWSAMLVGAFVAFYAFIGFEDLVHTAEEAKDVEKSLPKAIYISLIVATVFYVAIALAAVATLTPEELQDSAAPLVDVVKSEGRSGKLLGGLSLLIIVNGALAQLIMASRTIFDLGERRRGAPELLTKVAEKTGTPVPATLLCAAVILALALFFPTDALAKGTSFIMLLVFLASNIALIALDRKGGEPETGASYPDWVPYGGAILCVLLLVGQVVLGSGGH